MAKTHKLKIWPEFFNDVISGERTFEFRRDDRGYEVGDLLILEEYLPMLGSYSDRKATVRVKYIWRNSRNANKVGLPDGFCVMSIEQAMVPELIGKLK